MRRIVTLLNKIILHVKFIFNKVGLLNSDVKIHPTSIIDSSSRFEGANKVYRKSSLKNTIMGYGTYVGWHSILDNCVIGKYCSIAPNVEIIYGRHPTSGFLSSHPAFFSVSKQAGFTYAERTVFDEHKYLDKDKKVSCVIGNDVWIGSHAKILEGVKIGHGAIVAAGSLVTKDIEPYAICGGNPARVLKMRFSSKTVDFILKEPWWDKEPDWIRKNIDTFKGEKWLD
ncbi:CatB-related O-acetyltransferase [Vibrio splendidus]